VISESKVLFDYGEDGEISFVQLEALDIYSKSIDTCLGPSNYSDEPWNGGCSAS
jgi:hypothetical protein